MAQGTDHIVGGIAIWLVSAYLLRQYISSFPVLSLFFVCAVAGSLFPDIDVKSKGQKLFYGIMAPAYIFLFTQDQYALCFLVGLCALLPIMCTHRGLFHRWWFIVPFATLWGFAIVRMFPQYTDLDNLGYYYFLSWVHYPIFGLTLVF